MQKINKKGLNLIKKWEKLELKSYQKKYGNKFDVPTIGYGHTKGIKLGDIITIAKAEELLLEDISIWEKYLDNILVKNNIKLNPNQFSALVSFCFNTGELKENMVERLKKLPKTNNIGQSLLMYTYANNTHVEGLLNRRKEEKTLWEENI